MTCRRVYELDYLLLCLCFQSSLIIPLNTHCIVLSLIFRCLYSVEWEFFYNTVPNIHHSFMGRMFWVLTGCQACIWRVCWRHSSKQTRCSCAMWGSQPVAGSRHGRQQTSGCTDNHAVVMASTRHSECGTGHLICILWRLNKWMLNLVLSLNEYQ